MASILVTAGLAALITIPQIPPDLPGAGQDLPIVLAQTAGGGNNGNNGGRSGDRGGGERVDCRAAAAQAVGQTGGQLLSARPAGGACVITILVPGKGNQRPRKVTMRVGG